MSDGGAAGRDRINRDIEVLRAVAILLVVLAHIASVLPQLRLIGQWTGVDLFFCISGFVISRSFQGPFDKAAAGGRWFRATAAFWIRRAFRLAPSAWLWLGVAVLGALVFNSSQVWGTPGAALKSACYFLALATNFGFAAGSISVNAFFWTLTLEDQFYFLFPFFLLIVRPELRWLALLVLIALQWIPDRSFGPNAFPAYWWVFRLDALMWGIVVYQLARSELWAMLEPRFLRFAPLAAALSIGAVYLLVILPRGELGYYFGYIHIESQIALVCASLVFVASYDRGYVLPMPAPLRAVMMWIGARSYGIYLIHIPLMRVLQESWHLIGWSRGAEAFFAVGLLVLLPVVTELNFRFVEMPLRRRGAAIAARVAEGRSLARGAPATGPVGFSG